MKIDSARGAGASSPTRRAGAPAGAGFVPSGGAPAAPNAIAPTAAPPAIDAILALQAEGMAGDRRARQLRRGQSALDLLDQLAAALASGRAPAAIKQDLENARRGAEETGEDGLDAVLLEIDIRLAVELAKLERAAPRA